MSSSALLMMVLAEGTITVMTVYFFWKVLTIPPKPEPDSYAGNDEEPR
ncbi:MAG: hypothetical protein M0011_12460 [Elusimicrobia bacterium]|nr:hypothetical protein [Elusimicrobiota bacterium]